jgi:hypothetical protein
MTDPVWLQEQRFLVEACFELRVPFVWLSPGTFLIRSSGVPSVIGLAEKAGWRVLGLDGFELEGDVVRPRLDLIFDAERTPDRSPVEVAESWGSNVWIDLTIA